VPPGSAVDMSGRIEAQIERFAPGFRRPDPGPGGPDRGPDAAAQPQLHRRGHQQRRRDTAADPIPAHTPVEPLPRPPARRLPMLGVHPTLRRRPRHVRARGSPHRPGRPGRPCPLINARAVRGWRAPLGPRGSQQTHDRRSKRSPGYRSTTSRRARTSSPASRCSAIRIALFTGSRNAPVLLSGKIDVRHDEAPTVTATGTEPKPRRAPAVRSVMSALISDGSETKCQPSALGYRQSNAANSKTPTRVTGLIVRRATDRIAGQPSRYRSVLRRRRSHLPRRGLALPRPVVVSPRRACRHRPVRPGWTFGASRTGRRSFKKRQQSPADLGLEA
jgi:hypothetical protein